MRRLAHPDIPEQHRTYPTMYSKNTGVEGASPTAIVVGGCACAITGAAVGYALSRMYETTRSPSSTTVTDMFVYPIKSCAGIRVTRAKVNARGLEGDRLFMITNFLGRMQTQRVLPKMATIRPLWTETGDLLLSAPGMPDFVLPADRFNVGQRRQAQVWRHTCEDAIDQGDDVADWLAQALEASGLRLVRMPDDHRRVVEPGFVEKDGVHLASFADGYPFLLTTTCSLEHVRENSGIPTLSMSRFRPNIVVSGDKLTPFVEDNWREVRISQVPFEVPKRCTRCQVPRVDPLLGVLGEEEPSGTLKRTHGNMFGMNMVPLEIGGYVSVGDCLLVDREAAWDEGKKKTS